MVFLAMHEGVVGVLLQTSQSFSQPKRQGIRGYAPEAGTECLVRLGHCRFGRFNRYYPGEVFLAQRAFRA